MMAAKPKLENMAELQWETDNKTYREQGSYRFTFAQRRSMVLACSVEIVSQVKVQYESTKSNPPNGHYGYAVVFHGADPIRRIDLEFPVTRLFTVTNELATNAVGQFYITDRLTRGLKIFYDCLSVATKFCSTLQIVEPPPVTLPGHSETIVKVKCPEGTQFNIIVYWVAIPDLGLSNVEVDGSDGSDGLDEYPRPELKDPSDPYEGNPGESARDPRNDERDYSDNDFEGGQCAGVVYNIYATRIRNNGNGPPIDPACEYFNDGELLVWGGAIGPIGGVSTELERINDTVVLRLWKISDANETRTLGGFFEGCNGAGYFNFRVERADGEPDEC